MNSKIYDLSLAALSLVVITGCFAWGLWEALKAVLVVWVL